MAGLDKEHLDIILENEEVKKAIAKAGEDAMKNPEVQAKMLEVAKDKFPDMIDGAADKIAEWAHDPEMHAKALTAASWAFEEAKDLMEYAVEDAYDLIKQGPTGVRVLAFIGSCGALVIATWDCVKFWNGALHPSQYVRDVWQMCFAFSSALFEANPMHIEKSKLLDKWHDLLCEYAKFLCFPLGRAVFYFFQSSMWIAEAFYDSGIIELFKEPKELIKFVIGCYLAVIGIFNLWMHWGIMPVEGLNKSAKMAAPVVTAARQTMVYMADKFDDITGRGSRSGSLKENLNKEGSAGEIELGGPPAFKNND